jgi:hypothetical protein
VGKQKPIVGHEQHGCSVAVGLQRGMISSPTLPRKATSNRNELISWNDPMMIEAISRCPSSTIVYLADVCAKRMDITWMNLVLKEEQQGQQGQ